MVENITTLSHSGFKDWFIQRVTAIILGLYALFLLGYLVFHPQLNYADWQALFANSFVRLFSFLSLLSLVAHCWVGVWTIFTDYIKITSLRLILTVIMILALLIYLAWGIKILWG